ncbi:hypothetical protein VNI00_016619 [Paramarasmius palmivorus]|uniref:Uncharacterized protein n=1 Tax=Paramarasmius palmivorus TaxID=297713 RepID=A0AAW0BBU5_9AGAR
MPDGLLLFSPSCDASHAFPPSPSTWHTPRPNADTDYLTDTPEPRLLLQKTFLGFKHQIEQNDINQRRLFFLSGMGNVLVDGVGSVYTIGRSGVGSVYNLGRTGVGSVVNLLRGAGGTNSNPGTPQLGNTTPAFVGSTPQLTAATPAFVTNENNENETANAKHPTDKEMEQDTLLQQIIHSEYVSPASPVVLKRWGHPVDLYDGGWMCACPAGEEEGGQGCEEVCGKQRPGWRRSLMRRVSGDGGKHGHTHVVLRGNESFVTDTETDGTASPEVVFKKPAGLDVGNGRGSGEGGEGGRSRSSSAASSVAMLPPPPPPQEDIRLSTLSAPHPQHAVPQPEAPRITITPSPPSPSPSSSSSPTLAPLGRKHRHLRTQTHDQPQPHDLPHAYEYKERYPRWGKLFEGFPRTLILCGTAERLTVEVGNLVRGMGRDIDGSSGALGGKTSGDGETKVKIHWIPDAVHDVFIIPPGWWDEDVKRKAWEDVRSWVGEVRKARE